MSSPEHKQKIWKMIKDIKVGMLVTLDHDTPRARPMHLVQDEYDGTLWFFPRRSAEKVFETKSDHDVCLSFSDQEDGVYVSLSGKANLTDNRELIEKYWNPFIAAWYDGKRDPKLRLLRLDLDHAHVWLNEHSLLAGIKMKFGNDPRKDYKDKTADISL